MASVTVKNLTLRFPVYGADNRSLKKQLAMISVGGKIGKAAGRAPVITALSDVNMKLRAGDRLARARSRFPAASPPCSIWRWASTCRPPAMTTSVCAA